ncbi:hypothetical protein PHYSODRAFT_525316, partial [Phytophthora sojae]
KKPKKKRRRDRNRPWHEIARLQSESEALERQLDQHLTNSSNRARVALRSRNENATLRKMLQESVEDIQELEQNLLQQMKELVQSLPRSLVLTRNLQYDGARDDIMFRLMANSVDAQYKDMDRVMSRDGLVGLNTEVVESSIVGNYACVMRVVIKEFVESDRVVQVWNTVADWPRVGKLHNVRTQEYGWGYIQPLRNGTSVTAGRILVSPTINGLTLSESCEATRSLTRAYQDMIMARLQALENQTMDQLVREQRHGYC